MSVPARDHADGLERFRGDGTQTYQFLDDREEVIWGLDFVQLVYVLLGALAAILFGLYVSPLPPQLTLFFSILLAGLPVVVSLVATRGNIAPWTATRVLWHWATGPKRFAPAGSRADAGYLVARPPTPAPAAGQRAATPVLEEAWDL